MDKTPETGGEKANTVVLCGANSYTQKYYFNPAFSKLPEQIKRELQIMCVTFTEDAGGILTLEFQPDGQLNFNVRTSDGDYLFDDIESGLQISRYQKEKQELLEELELFYRVVFLGLRVEDSQEDNRAE